MLIRVAVVTPGSFPLPSPTSSSVEQVVYETAQQLKHDVQYHIFSKKTKSLKFRDRDAHITYYRLLRSSVSVYLNKVRSRLRTIRPHIIQVENRPRYVTYFKKKFPKTPVWLTLHSTRYISRPHISASVLKRCLRQADKIIVNSHFLANYVQQKYPISSEKLMVNHLGTDLNRFSPKWFHQGNQMRNAMRQELGYVGKRIVIYVGRLLPAKGVHLLLKALPEITEEYPDTVLVVVGSAYYGSHRTTPYVRDLHQAGNRLPENVRFVPFVSHDEIHKWYQLADIAVVPSQGEEAFGLTNVEAMASGLPVIATKTGGMVELIQHGETGFLVEPGKIGVPQFAHYIKQLFREPEYRRVLGEKAREQVERNFTWAHTSERLLAAYKEAVKL